MSETPDVKQIERVIGAMSPEQFSALCAELGLIEAQLGEGRTAQIVAVVDAMQTAPGGLPRLARSIRHVWPTAFDTRPRRKIKLSLPIGPVLGGLALIAIVVVVAIIVLNALNPSTPVADFRVTASPAPTQGLILVPRTPTPVTPTVTDTPEPTATPNVNATLTATYAPSLTPTPRATPTRTPRPTSNATSTPTPTPTPIVALIYSRVLLRAPTSNSTVDPTVKVQMTWLLPNVPELRSDERFRLHVWQDQKVIFEKLTSDSWYDWYGGPNGELGTFQWSVSVVRVDDVGEVLGLLSPESETWNITWKTK